MAKLAPDDQLAEDLSRFYADPLAYVMYAFPWDTERSIRLVPLKPRYRERFGCEFGPDEWACEFLDELGVEIKKRRFDGSTAVEPIRFATVSGHGIGKTALTSWLIKFILDTRPRSVGTVTAMTAEQLKVKTWAELGRWHKMSLTSHWFDYTSGRGAMALKSNRLDAEGNSLGDKWICTALTCKEETSESFAGQHAPMATSFYIFDEASGVPDAIYTVRDGGLTDGESMAFDFGNGTRNSGRFFEECMGDLAHRYITRSIDSRDVHLTSKPYLQEMIDDYGEESDRVKVRVRGMFPSAGSAQYLPSDGVNAAMERPLVRATMADALVIGVDVAGFGDDETVIYPRIGFDARSFTPVPGDGRYSSLDTVAIVGKVTQKVTFFRELGLETAMIFVDATGEGSGVASMLQHLGYPTTRVHFGGSPTDSSTYRYKGDEMWGAIKNALPDLFLPPATAPSGPELRKQLTQREFAYTVQGNRIHMEPKKDMKKRLLGSAASPDIADALACTFAQEVVAVAVRGSDLYRQGQQVKHEFDPMDERY